jgi:hypothetical protein
MQAPLSPAATLDLWADAERRGPVERTLVLAAAGGDDGAGPGDLVRLPLGRRDSRLLSLHLALGGRTLEATAACPACGEQAEFAVPADVLVKRAGEGVPPAPVEVDGFVVAWRPPDSADLAAAAGEAGDAAVAERVLLSRCVLSATGPDGEVARTELPLGVRAALAQAMAEADPLAEVLVDVSCPACGTAFVADLELGGFVWAELRAHAQRLLRDVAVLARAYGWTEPDVLALDEPRRAAYLELAREAMA